MQNRREEELSIFISGVGGQGVTGYGKMLQRVLFQSDRIADLVSTESRGVSQREGMVYYYIRALMEPHAETNLNKIPKTLTPKPQEGQAKIYIGLEPLEFFRNLRYLHPSGLAILNTHPIIPKNTLLSPEIAYPPINKMMKKIPLIFPAIHFIHQNFTEIGQKNHHNPFYGVLHITTYVLEKYPQIFTKSNLMHAVKRHYPQFVEFWEAFFQKRGETK